MSTVTIYSPLFKLAIMVLLSITNLNKQIAVQWFIPSNNFIFFILKFFIYSFLKDKAYKKHLKSDIIWGGGGGCSQPLTFSTFS